MTVHVRLSWSVFARVVAVNVFSRTSLLFAELPCVVLEEPPNRPASRTDVMVPVAVHVAVIVYDVADPVCAYVACFRVRPTPVYSPVVPEGAASDACAEDHGAVDELSPAAGVAVLFDRPM